jgi:hypothetical protein
VRLRLHRISGAIRSGALASEAPLGRGRLPSQPFDTQTSPRRWRATPLPCCDEDRFENRRANHSQQRERGKKKTTREVFVCLLQPPLLTSPLRLARVAEATEREGVARQRRG